MSTTTDKSLSFIESTFKSLIWDPEIKTALAALYVAAPFLSFWPFSVVINGVVDLIGNYLFSGFTLVVDVSAIKLKNEEHQAAYDKSSVTLAIIAHDKGIESNDFSNAREAAKIAMSQFTSINR